MSYTKVILDALVENPDDKDVSRMVVVINQETVYQDFADFHKHNPEWWEELGNKIYGTSPYPKLSIAPYCIAAAQYLCDESVDIQDKVVPLISKAMALDEENMSVQRLAKIAITVGMGAVPRPTVEQSRQQVMPSTIKEAKRLDEMLQKALEE